GLQSRGRITSGRTYELDVAALLPTHRGPRCADARLRPGPRPLDSLPVLDPYRARRPGTGAGRLDPQPSESPSRPPCDQSAVPRQELRCDAHRLGLALRNVYRRDRETGLRNRQAARELQRDVGPSPLLVRARGDDARRTPSDRQAPGLVRVAGLEAG